MTRRILAVRAFGALLLAACGTSAPDDSTQQATAAPLEMCDGSPGLRFTFRIEGGRLPEDGYLFMGELGSEYLFVAGDCHYWAWAHPRELTPHSRWYSTQEGQLTPDDAKALASDVRYSDWANLSQSACSAGFDAETFVLHDRTRAVECTGPAGSSAFTAAWDWSLRLYNAGTPVAGPMRILAMVDTRAALPDMVPAAWPLAEPIGGFVVTHQQMPLSFLITDPADTQALRQTRQD
jgi:hypothetical protein